MELTRRDTLAALAALGAGCASPEDASGGGPEGTETLVALAEVLYPSEVEGVGSFVADYSLARVEDRPDYRAGMEEAIDELNGHAGAFYEAPFPELSESERDEALRGLGVDDADPVPEGNRRERVRYYLVDELLFALYSTPVGGEIVGTENPPGHPGGTRSYRAEEGGRTGRVHRDANGSASGGNTSGGNTTDGNTTDHDATDGSEPSGNASGGER